MRGSMDVVDAERLQRSGVAMVELEEKRCIYKRNHGPYCGSIPIILSQ